MSATRDEDALYDLVPGDESLAANPGIEPPMRPGYAELNIT